MTRSGPNPLPEDSYAGLFEGILRFADFTQAEECLARLEKMRQRFLAAGDKEGVDHCILVARQGRQRARLIGRNPRVDPVKRLQKKEIAFWFRVWLETPDLFAEWLALRKETAQFRELRERSSGGS